MLPLSVPQNKPVYTQKKRQNPAIYYVRYHTEKKIRSSIAPWTTCTYFSVIESTIILQNADRKHYLVSCKTLFGYYLAKRLSKALFIILQNAFGYYLAKRFSAGPVHSRSINRSTPLPIFLQEEGANRLAAREAKPGINIIGLARAETKSA